MDVLQAIHDQVDEYLGKVRWSLLRVRWRNRVSCLRQTSHLVSLPL